MGKQSAVGGQGDGRGLGGAPWSYLSHTPGGGQLREGAPTTPGGEHRGNRLEVPDHNPDCSCPSASKPCSLAESPLGSGIKQHHKGDV